MQRDAEEDDEVLVEVRSWTYLAECDLGSPPSPGRKRGGGQQERKRSTLRNGPLGQTGDDGRAVAKALPGGGQRGWGPGPVPA